MAKRATPKYEPEPTPEVSNDDILTAVRRVEKTLVAMTKDIADLSEDVDALASAIPKAQIPPNDGPAPDPAPVTAAEPAVTVAA